MLVKPTVSDLLKKVDDNRYSLVIMTSKRARQIANGATVKVETEDRSPVTVAAEEIEAGKVVKTNDEYADEK
jgi:DNA-directed RNA polymerase subunit omega